MLLMILMEMCLLLIIEETHLSLFILDIGLFKDKDLSQAFSLSLREVDLSKSTMMFSGLR